MTYDEILTRFDVKKIQGNTAHCICPNHNDNSPSLHITKGEESALVHCKACGKDELENILGRVGLETKDLFYDAGNTEFKGDWKYNLEKFLEKKIKDFYNYTDDAGNYIYTKVRFTDKDFRFGKIENNNTFFNMQGKKNKGIYNVQQLVNAKKGSKVYYVEGEKDVHTLNNLGLLSVTAGGASDWKRKFCKYFEGMRVIIVADNDKPGEESANLVEKHLTGIAKSVKIIKPSNREHGDITDFFEDGFTIADLEKVEREVDIDKGGFDEKGGFMPISESLTYDPIIKPEFIIERLIYRNCINIISGDPKTFKTILSADIAVAVATNTEALGQYIVEDGGKVLFISPEIDPRDTIIKIARTGFNYEEALNNIICPKKKIIELMRWQELKPLIENVLEEQEVKLVVLDPLTYIFDKDINKNDDVLEFMRDLKAMIEKYQVTFLITHHNNRAETEKLINRMSGASAIPRSADSIIFLEKFNEDTEQDFFKTDEELDNEAQAIKLIKGTYRYGGAGYKYHKVSLEFAERVITIQSERLTKNGEQPQRNIKSSEAIEMIRTCIIKALKEGTLHYELFTFLDVVSGIKNPFPHMKDSYYERKIRETLSKMVKENELTSITGKGYTNQMKL